MAKVLQESRSFYARVRHYPAHLWQKTNRPQWGGHKFRRYYRPVRQWLSLERDTGTDRTDRELMDAARLDDSISFVTPARPPIPYAVLPNLSIICSTCISFLTIYGNILYEWQNLQ